MAEPEARPPADQPVMENEEKKLKYLDFVQVAAIYVVVCCSALYEYAKENSGPLRPGVQTVEGTVKTVIGPVYEKFRTVPFELLKFVDRKVNLPNLLSCGRIHNRVGPSRAGNSEADFAPSLDSSSGAPEVVRQLASEVQKNGLVDTASEIAKTAYTRYEPTAKELYARYEPVAEQYAVAAWRSLNRLPLFSQVAHIMVPTAAYWAEKYNQAVSDAAERGCTASYYLPLVPIERIAKTFGETENVNEAAVSVNGEYVAVPS
ncbi:UNVERIFIED_CONTAM: Stress-related protein [Sesamum angustifolium]|uniref:Stress-related protein n=1 Tax=Sesamum angustifolium TaxID=2727405 RepID=A0AAW2QRS3_9LAMI